MAMTEINDELLEQFFQPAKNIQIEDNGFTNRVMKELPDRALRLSQWWTLFCILLGVVAFVVFRGWEPIMVGLLTLLKTNFGELQPIPFFVAMGVISCLAGLELFQKMEHSQI
jgi:hypothetical protein